MSKTEKKVRNRIDFMYIDPAFLSWSRKLLEVKPITNHFFEKRLLRNATIIFLLLLTCFCHLDNPIPVSSEMPVLVNTLQREYLWVPEKEGVTEPTQLAQLPWASIESKNLGMIPKKNFDLWIRFPDASLVKFKNPVLFIEIGLEYLDVFYDSKNIYSFRKRDYVFPHIIPLTNKSHGFIYIRAKSSYAGYVGIDHYVAFQDHSDVLIKLFSENHLRLFLAPVLVFLAFLFLIVFLIRVRTKINLYFSLLLFSSALIEGLNSFIGYTLQSYTNFIAPIMYINFMLCPFLLLVFLREIYPPFFKSIFKILVFLHFFIYALYCYSNWNSGFSFLNNEKDFAWWVIAESTLIIFSSIYVVWKGQLRLGLISFGLLAIVITGTHDTLIDMDILSYEMKLIHLGFCLGILSFSFFVFKYYLDIVRSLDETNRDLQKKNKELERLVAIDKDLLLAKELQKSLLSEREKEDKNINIVSFNHSLQSIGGDYFDYMRDSLGNWGILICDVAGHGISSAVVAAMSKMAFTATMPYLQFPEKVFTSMNRNLFGKNRGMFITASYMYIDMDSKILSFVNAGHPGFYLIRKDSSGLMEMKTKGRPLGIFSESNYGVETLRLESGDKIFIYTDGIVELNSASTEAYGESRLERLLFENRSIPFQDHHRLIQDDLYAFSSAWKYQDDDVSYIMIEIK